MNNLEKTELLLKEGHEEAAKGQENLPELTEGQLETVAGGIKLKLGCLNCLKKPKVMSDPPSPTASPQISRTPSIARPPSEHDLMDWSSQGNPILRGSG